MSTSYSNLGGSGVRSTLITVTSNIPFQQGGGVAFLVSGGYVNSYWNNSTGSVAGFYIQFQFTTTQNGTQNVIIDEAKWYQDVATSQGVWQWQGSNDGSAWTNIGSTFTLGGATTQTMTTLNGNVTSYGYYQILGISGNFSNVPFDRGIDFQISGFTFTATFPPNMQRTFFTQVPTFPPNMQRTKFTLAETNEDIRSLSLPVAFRVSKFMNLAGGPVPVAQVLSGATVGVVYSETISGQHGTSPYTFAVASGTLPAGTSLNTSTGVISGTPTTANTYSFTILVTDADSATGTFAFSITVSMAAAGGSSSFGWVS